jgi:hypothetical protein
LSDYVLNRASLEPFIVGHEPAKNLVRTLIQTVADLDDGLGGAPRAFRVPQDVWELPFAKHAADGPILTLGELANSLYEGPDTRDLATFFDALQTYSPAVEGLLDAEIDAILRFTPTKPANGYENLFDAITKAGFDAIQCAIVSSILISVDQAEWNFDHARFRSGDRELQFDHASRPVHASAIIDRARSRVRDQIGRENFEGLRIEAFPLLEWGADVSDQVSKFSADFLALAFKRLATLDDIARRWQTEQTVAPETGNIIFRSESDLTMQNYENDRKFRSSRGTVQTYEKHVWIDRGNRIHFIIKAKERTFEIGYIGPHLRTWTN